MLHGIDMSNWNHPLDPTAVPGDFVIMRASEGKGMRDERFAAYDAQVRPSPRLAGAYHFCWVGTEGVVVNTPQQEAANFAAAVKDHLRPGFLLICDWEPRYHGRNTGWAVDFAHEVKRLTGRTPILYANLSTLDGGDWSRWRAEIGTDYWLAGGTAQYAQRTDGYTPGTKPRNPRGWGDPLMWQMTEYGYLPGWPGRLDLNEFYGTADDWRRIADPKEAPVTYKTLRGFRFDEATYWWFLALEELARAKGWVKDTIDLYQAIGGSPKSGGTHTAGGAIDCYQSADPRALLRAARNGGGAAWHRTPAQGFSHHLHIGIKGLSPKPYDYQVRALENGRNGLVNNRADDGPRDGVRWPLRSYKDGLAWLRAETQKALAEKAKPVTAPATPRAASLPDFFNAWPAIREIDGFNPSDASLTGLGDATLRELLIAHGFTFYDRGDLHQEMLYGLADILQGWALSDTPRDSRQIDWDLLQYVTKPAPPMTWVELRPAFDAAHAGGAFGRWGEQRTRHSVRAIQAGLNHFSGGSYLPETGIYDATTRQAVSNFQVAMRGATAGTPAADGVVGIHDALHLVIGCSRRVGRPHRLRFIW